MKKLVYQTIAENIEELISSDEEGEWVEATEAGANSIMIAHAQESGELIELMCEKLEDMNLLESDIARLLAGTITPDYFIDKYRPAFHRAKETTLSFYSTNILDFWRDIRARDE